MNNRPSKTPNDHERKDKPNNKITQLQTIFSYLLENTATATMTSEATGVPQKSICRFKRDLEKQGILVEVYKKPCTITGHKAYYLTIVQR